MTLRFVKTAVLSSRDGVDFSDEVTVESEEARAARLAAERAAARPLYEQLAAQQAKKQAEYDANTKLLFAPPKAIDEEEFAFLQDIQDRREQEERWKRQQEQQVLEAFREKQRATEDRKDQETLNEDNPLTRVIQTAAVARDTKKMIPQIKVIKRRKDTAEDRVAPELKKHRVADDNPIASVTLTPAATSAATQSVISSLGEYGSDDDDAGR